MPQMHYYEVRQTRVVRVAAGDTVDAAKIADAAFEGKHNLEGVEGSVTSLPHITNLMIREEI